MAENEDGQQKDLEPSAKRREKARSEGQVAVSKDVNGAAQLLMASLALGFMGPAIFNSLLRATRDTFAQTVTKDGELPAIGIIGGGVLSTVLYPVGVFCVLVALAALVAGLWQTKLLFSWGALQLKPERLNPLKGLKNLFGPKALVGKLGLPVLKMTVGIVVVYTFLHAELPAIAALAFGDVSGVISLLTRDISKLLFVTTAVLCVVSAADWAWQHHRHEEGLKMTREEHKRETIEQEGQPHVKARRRQMHRQLTLNRIIDVVPFADVVVTNPTHLAIALRFRPGQDKAPLVTAKGADDVAAFMRRLARKHGIAIVENKPLARTLWRRVKVGQAVPRTMFQAVAEVLARVFRARSQRARA